MAPDDPYDVDARAILDRRPSGHVPARVVAGLAAMALCGLALLAIDLVDGDGTASFLGGLGLAILPVPLLVSLVLALDPLEPEPLPALAFAFLWGAGVAVLLAAVLNTLGLHYVTAPIFGSSRGEQVTACVGAPFVEESLKGAVLFGYLRYYRQELDELNDGIVFGAMVAIGFAMMENITYYMRASAHHELAGVFLLRGIIAPFGHPLFTAMTGLGVSYAALNPGRTKLRAPLLGLAAAMLLHGIWNYALTFGLAGLAVSYALDACVLAALLLVIAKERRTLARLMKSFLTGYTSTGLVSDADIRMLGSPALRRRARRWARLRGGPAAARAMGHYQLAATELVLSHKMQDRGLMSQETAESRRASLIRLMRLSLITFQATVRSPVRTPWATEAESAFQHPSPRTPGLRDPC